MAGFLMFLEKVKLGLKIDVLREVGRQYPVFCFLLLSLVVSHVLMVFWSFLAGVTTFYCSLGPESLVPNIFFPVKQRNRLRRVREGEVQTPPADAAAGELSAVVRPESSFKGRRFSSRGVRVSSGELCVPVVPVMFDVPAVFADKSVEGLQQAALDEFGADLHIALRSRKDELLYLRKLTEMLFPYETVNLLVLIFVDDTPLDPATEPPSPLVPFLQKYADVSSKKQSVLKLDLKEIREQQDLLFRFMNFLKQEGAVHVLQFCLTRLHGEVVRIYETYCLEESIDKISFDPFIVDEIRNIAIGPYGGVVKLQTMHCLFEAYEHVLSLLERVFTPMFCHSDEYFRHLLRGAESPTRNSRISRNSFSCEESRIGSKIKGVFRNTPMEGAMLPPYNMNDMDEDMVEEATVVMEDDSPAEPPCSAGSLRNLSFWSVGIPYIDLCDDDNKRDKIPVFCIDVERNDRKEGNKVLRQRGTFADAQLPSKRIIGPKNLDFLESKREEFEEYLQRLLQHPELSNSQLLADFLSPHSMESQFLERMLPDMFKSVPGKLIKEKGQNLDPFLQSFFNSCESPKAKPSRPELTILSPSNENNKKLFNDLFRNNANLSERKHNANFFEETLSVDGMYDYMMYAYMDQYLQSKLEQILQEHNVVSLITQLRDAVFCESSEELKPEEKQSRAKKTFEDMMNYLPDVVVKCIGQDSKYEGVRLLFNGFQQPVLNKQMTYVLLDIAVQELFPELSKE
ncbi:hypothetical protein F7725_020033 [Dissostichus mawsoni]|uniref:Sorting nexin 14 n=1 Tax=Dissostichus mawsoni TaxID=36200 RepID=A0A7J5YLE6_DISMA|nr:hypothetical protein F7725_020033 [Dissostichus mawsoni]